MEGLLYPFCFKTGYLQIPENGSIQNLMTYDISNGCYDVFGTSSVDAMKDYGILLVFKKMAFFKPLNQKSILIIFTRGASTAEWNSPFKYVGTSI